MLLREILVICPIFCFRGLVLTDTHFYFSRTHIHRAVFGQGVAAPNTLELSGQLSQHACASLPDFSYTLSSEDVKSILRDLIISNSSSQSLSAVPTITSIDVLVTSSNISSWRRKSDV